MTADHEGKMSAFDAQLNEIIDSSFDTAMEIGFKAGRKAGLTRAAEICRKQLAPEHFPAYNAGVEHCAEAIERERDGR